jgi:hypothetical protein
MLTVRASKKRRFFMRRDGILIRRRAQRPRAGTRAHILFSRAKKKILSNETKNSQCSFYLRVLCLFARTTRPFYLSLFSFISRGKSSSLGFSLAKNPSSVAFEINFFRFLGGEIARVPRWTDDRRPQKKRTKKEKLFFEPTFDTLNKMLLCLSFLLRLL